MKGTKQFINEISLQLSIGKSFRCDVCERLILGLRFRFERGDGMFNDFNGKRDWVHWIAITISFWETCSLCSENRFSQLRTSWSHQGTKRGKANTESQFAPICSVAWNLSRLWSFFKGTGLMMMVHDRKFYRILSNKHFSNLIFLSLQIVNIRCVSILK